MGKEKKIAVVETFGPVIQGEGPLAGSKTMFIRFGGCDYRCVKCDSLHAVLPEAVKVNASYLTAAEIAEAIIPAAKASGTPWVTLSGGNPCMWDLTELIHLLQTAGLAIALETQGTLAPEWLWRCQMIVISPKSPGMGEKFEEDKFTKFLHKTMASPKGAPKPATAIKIVIFSVQDIEFALHVEQVARLKVAGCITPGLTFLSLGNEAPPKLNGEQGLTTSVDANGEALSQSDHVIQLLDSYRILVEEVCNDARIHHWRFLPQLHVLLYGNEAER